MPDRNNSPTVTKQSLVDQRRHYSLSPKKRNKFPPAPSQRFSGPDASSLETKQKTPYKPNIVPEKLGPPRPRRFYRGWRTNIKESDSSDEDPDSSDEDPDSSNEDIEVEDKDKLNDYEKLKNKLISELQKLNLDSLLGELKINENEEIYKNILENDINDYDEANKKLLENIKIFIENKKELDEI